MPVIICWGYYATELSWLNVNGMMAVLQTNISEAVEYVKDRTGIRGTVSNRIYPFHGSLGKTDLQDRG